MSVTIALGQLRSGQKGIIVQAPEATGFGRRLIELGFITHAEVVILAEAPFGGDPILVKVHGTRVAIRREDAAQILVRTLSEPA